MEEEASRMSEPLFMGEMLAELRAGDSVLDLGCGKGSFSYADYPGLRICALDVTPPELALPDHVQFRLGSAEALPYQDGMFRLVIANYVFEHFADFARALQETERVLGVGGWLYMSVPNARSFEDFLYRALYAGGGHLQQPTLEWIIRQVYRHTNLKLIRYTDWPAGMVFFGQQEEMRAFTSAILSTVKRVTGEDLRARSNYVLLFRKESGRGYRTVRYVCGYCGDGVGLDDSAGDAAEPASWVCPHCGCTNVMQVEATQIQGAQLQKDLQAFEARTGVRLEQRATITSDGSEGDPAPLSSVELEEVRWLTKWSHRFRSHLRLYTFLRRLKRLVFR